MALDGEIASAKVTLNHVTLQPRWDEMSRHMSSHHCQYQKQVIRSCWLLWVVTDPSERNILLCCWNTQLALIRIFIQNYKVALVILVASAEAISASCAECQAFHHFPITFQ